MQKKAAAGYSKKELLVAYENCLKARFLDDRLQREYFSDTERIPNFFSGIGSEVGPGIVACLLDRHDYLVPHYRGFAALLAKGLQPNVIAREFFSKKMALSKRRMDATPPADPTHHISGSSMILGANFSIALGLAFARVFKKESGIVMHIFGDGEASRSTFGSALNLASLRKLPLLFVCENNGVSIASKLKEMSSTSTVALRAKGYGILGETVRDTKPLDLYRRAKIRLELGK